MSGRTTRAAGAAGILAALGVAGAALGVAVSGPAAGSSPQVGTPSVACTGSAPKMTVQGTGRATATPDVLTAVVGIDVTDPTAQSALADDNARASAVTAALASGGVPARDVQTANLSVQPRYDSHGNITGYEVTNTLTAKLRDFSRAGAVIDALTGAAGNAVRIDALTFSVADPRSLEDQARTQAVQQAVGHARAMAQAAGEHLGPVCSLSELPPAASEHSLALGGNAMQAPNASLVPLRPGTQETTANVTLVYALEPFARGG